MEAKPSTTESLGSAAAINDVTALLGDLLTQQ
jgi:hypothetical protein